MKILAIDLGSNTGWASGLDGKILKHGTHNWLDEESFFSGEAYNRFYNWLYANARQVHSVVVEVPNASMPGFNAIRVLFGMYGIVEMVCADLGISMVPVRATEIKKFWTGKGNATKDVMMVEATRRGLKFQDDNDVDAMAIYTYYSEVLRVNGKVDSED